MFVNFSFTAGGVGWVARVDATHPTGLLVLERVPADVRTIFATLVESGAVTVDNWREMNEGGSWAVLAPVGSDVSGIVSPELAVSS